MIVLFTDGLSELVQLFKAFESEFNFAQVILYFSLPVTGQGGPTPGYRQVK